MTDWIPNHHHFVTAGAALASSETALPNDHPHVSQKWAT